MIFHCPECSAGHSVPASMIPKRGLDMNCRRCAAKFLVEVGDRGSSESSIQDPAENRTAENRTAENRASEIQAAENDQPQSQSAAGPSLLAALAPKPDQSDADEPLDKTTEGPVDEPEADEEKAPENDSKLEPFSGVEESTKTGEAPPELTEASSQVLDGVFADDVSEESDNSDVEADDATLDNTGATLSTPLGHGPAIEVAEPESTRVGVMNPLAPEEPSSILAPGGRLILPRGSSLGFAPAPSTDFIQDDTDGAATHLSAPPEPLEQPTMPLATDRPSVDNSGGLTAELDATPRFDDDDEVTVEPASVSVLTGDVEAIIEEDDLEESESKKRGPPALPEPTSKYDVQEHPSFDDELFTEGAEAQARSSARNSSSRVSKRGQPEEARPPSLIIPEGSGSGNVYERVSHGIAVPEESRGQHSVVSVQLKRPGLLGALKPVAQAANKAPLALKVALVVFPVTLGLVLMLTANGPEPDPKKPIQIPTKTARSKAMAAKGKAAKAAPEIPVPEEKTVAVEPPSAAPEPPVEVPPEALDPAAENEFEIKIPEDNPAPPSYAFVQRTGVRIRAFPTRKGSVSGRLKIGQSVKLFEALDNWTLVMVEPNGPAGFISNRMIGDRKPVEALAPEVGFQGCQVGGDRSRDDCLVESKSQLDLCFDRCGVRGAVELSSSKARCTEICQAAFDLCAKGCAKPTRRRRRRR